MHLHIFNAGPEIKTEVYFDVLITVVKPWMDEVAAGRPYIFHDGAHAYTSHKTQAWWGERVIWHTMLA